MTVWFRIFGLGRGPWRFLSGGPATALARRFLTSTRLDFQLDWDGLVYGFGLSLPAVRFSASSSETWPLSILSSALLLNFLSLPGSHLKLDEQNVPADLTSVCLRTPGRITCFPLTFHIIISLDSGQTWRPNPRHCSCVYIGCCGNSTEATFSLQQQKDKRGSCCTSSNFPSARYWDASVWGGTLLTG